MSAFHVCNEPVIRAGGLTEVAAPSFLLLLCFSGQFISSEPSMQSLTSSHNIDANMQFLAVEHLNSCDPHSRSTSLPDLRYSETILQVICVTVYYMTTFSQRAPFQQWLKAPATPPLELSQNMQVDVKTISCLPINFQKL